MMVDWIHCHHHQHNRSTRVRWYLKHTCEIIEKIRVHYDELYFFALKSKGFLILIAQRNKNERQGAGEDENERKKSK